MAPPWDTGDPGLNWTGYFIPGTTVLRNEVGAVTFDQLRDAENDLVEARVIELRESPTLLGLRTYDLKYLRAIHRQLFQDVYLWAGDLRTVGIVKESGAFCPLASVPRAMDHVAAEVHRLVQLKDVSATDLPRTVAYLYDYVNFAHPFREGNGRSTREFFDLLLSERGAGIDWTRTDLAELHVACHTARVDADLSAMVSMFGRIIDDEAAYEF